MKNAIRRVRQSLNARIGTYNDQTAELAKLREADAPDVEAVKSLRDERAATFAEIEELRTQLDELEREQEQDEAVARLQESTTATDAQPGSTGERSGRVDSVREGRTYTQDADPQGRAFVADVASAFMGGWDAQARLDRHMREERVERGDQVARGVTTTGAPALVIPQYLVDMYAAKGRPGRKLADQMRHHDLPETGMTVYIPRQLAKTTVTDQAAQLTDASETDYTDEMISIPVHTASGSQTLARQSVERSLGTEDIVLEDLLKAYDNNLDDNLINAAVWGLDATAQTVTYTDAAPSASELYRKILAAGANIEDVLLDLDTDDVFTLMRSRRWAWMRGETTDKKPFVSQNGFDAVFGKATEGGYTKGVRGYLPDGGAVVTDNAIKANKGAATNQDAIYVVSRSEAHLWEDPNAPMYIRAETGTSMKKLGIDMVVYGYYAACFTRVVNPAGAGVAVHQKIDGTGLVAPTF